MAHRWHLTVVALLLTMGAHLTLRADIFRWDNGELIPGTEGIEPGPGVDLAVWRTDDHNLRYADFSGGLNLQSADFGGSWLDNADFSEADLTNARLNRATMTEADLTGAVVAGASLEGVTAHGFTKEQLYSTASYQKKDLRGIHLGGRNDLMGWDFRGQDLSHARFTADISPSDLTNANLSEANLTEVFAFRCNLFGANLSRANLTGSRLEESILTGADLSGADLTGAVLTAALDGANFSNAVIARAVFSTSPGLTKEQMYSTASYQAKDLTGIATNGANLAGWDLGGQDLFDAHLGGTVLTDVSLSNANLINASLSGATLGNTDLTGANLKNAFLRNTGLQSATFNSSTVYNQWTAFPDGFDPIDGGLTFESSPLGDFDANGVLNATDIDMLSFKMRRHWEWGWLRPMFDLTGDTDVDFEDHRFLVKDVNRTWYGDANFDGEFNSSDLIQVLVAGKYEERSVGHWCMDFGGWSGCTRWTEGDWNGDGVFNSSDMVTAFVDGGYERGLRVDVAAVPEPTAVLLLIPGLIGVAIFRRRLWS